MTPEASVKAVLPGGRQAASIDPGDRLRFALLMTVAIIACSLGDTSLKKGVGELPILAAGSLDAAVRLVWTALSNPWIAAGIVLMLIHFGAFVEALRLGPLSAVVPLRSATYVTTAILAHAFLGEQVPFARWVAVALILVGVCMVGRSATRQ